MLRFFPAGLMSLAVVAWGTVIQAEDAFYVIPLNELKITEGEVPKVENTTYVANDWSASTSPYALLDGAGEAYFASINRHELLSNVSNPGDLEIIVRAPAGKPVTGQFVVPWNRFRTPKPVRFEIAASESTPARREAFYTGKARYYEHLGGSLSAGAAWFRHQQRLALEQHGVSKLPRAISPAQDWQRAIQYDQTFELFSGGRALSENLQLDRQLAVSTIEKKNDDVLLADLTGITIAEIDWQPLLKDKQPQLDTLAQLIPADQHAVFFPSFTAFVTLGEQADRQGTPLLRVAEPQSQDARTVEKYEQQLCLTRGGLSKLLGPSVVKSVALTGSDLDFRVGTDLAILFEAVNPTVLEGLLQAQTTLKSQGVKGVETVSGEVSGVKYRGPRSPDRRVSSYVAVLNSAVVVTNSLRQLERIVSVQSKQAPALNTLDEFKFFRDRYPVGDANETGFIFLSDATIRRWCSAKWRIATSRRTIAAAVLAEAQATDLDRQVTGGTGNIELPTNLPPLAGGVQMTSAGPASAVYGTLEFMTPIVELDFDKVTTPEADAYKRWRDGYQRNWRWAFDPIGLRLTANDQRLAGDITIMPLIAGSQYNELIRISSGAKLAPKSLDEHPTLAHVALAVNKDSEVFARQLNIFEQMTGQAALNPLGWLNNSIELFADDDPFWQDVAQSKEKPERFLEREFYRLPLAIRVGSSNPLKLAVFLTGLRGFIEQSAPGLTKWETLKHNEQPYVKITPAQRIQGAEVIDKLAIYYAPTPQALLITLNESVLKRALDRHAARTRPDAKEAADNTAKAVERPWLGDSLCLRIDTKLVQLGLGFRVQDDQARIQRLAWDNIPILNEWRRRYPDRDPVKLHAEFWNVQLVCPGGGEYVWNDTWKTMESTIYGHPAEPKIGPVTPPNLNDFHFGNFGLTFEPNGLRARVELERTER